MIQRRVKEIEAFFDIKLSEPLYKANQHLHYVDDELKIVIRIPKALCSDWKNRSELSTILRNKLEKPAAILGDTVKEGKTDAEKLAIAVKALEDIIAVNCFHAIREDIARNALKEIE